MSPSIRRGPPTRKLFLAALCGYVLLGLTSTGAASQARLFEAPGPCDRDCLNAMVDSYLAALVAHDPDAAPLADDIRFTENTEVLEIGEGLWEIASGEPTSFKIHVPDPVARQVGFIGVMEASGNPIQLALRLKVDNGRIVEAEHLVVRNLSANSLANLQTPRPGLLAEVPPGERLARELMLTVASSYYVALEMDAGDATPFADDCERRENGMITAGGGGIGRGGAPRLGCHAQLDTRSISYIDSIDLRRVWIADEVTGLAFGLSQFRHSMENREIAIIGPDGERSTRSVDFDPFDLPAAHIIKIQDNRIHEIEALGFTTPYMSGNGWSDFLN